MKLLSGSIKESPQKTHAWNNHHLKLSQVSYLDTSKMIHKRGLPCSVKWQWQIRLYQIPYLGGVLKHLAIFGGWKNYAVVGPEDLEIVWYPGWTGQGFAGVSRIPAKGPVRLLIGPDDASFFGITSSGDQVRLKKVGQGKIGKNPVYSRIPLY